jgi:two-component system LytT family response regulator
LLKPIDEVELVETVRRLANTNTGTTQNFTWSICWKYKGQTVSSRTHCLSTLEGLEFVAVEQILRCESSSNYTIIYLLNASAMVVYRTLKEIEELLPASLFLRVHNSHVINKQHIRKYIKGAGGSIKMSDNCEVPVSHLRRDQVLKELTNIKA